MNTVSNTDILSVFHIFLEHYWKNPPQSEEHPDDAEEGFSMTRSIRHQLVRVAMAWAICLAAAVSAHAQMACQACGDGTPGSWAASCETQCNYCDLPAPDGYCEYGHEYTTTCAGYWGCCPNWQFVSDTVIGEGGISAVPLCEYVGFHRTQWNDATGCIGTWYGCYHHHISWSNWTPACTQQGWGERCGG